MCKMIPLSVPSLGGKEWEYAKDCIDSGWLSSGGKYVTIFENMISKNLGVKYSVATINGTSALHIALLLAEVKPDDEVIVPTITFIATINAVIYCNAYPVFMDADNYYNIDIEKTIEFILNETELRSDGYSYNKKTNRRVSAIIPVHVFGNAVWLDDLVAVCEEKNIKIIEDATEALGTRYNTGNFKNKFAGSIGICGCLSFNVNKIITTGGGGMILTDNLEYAKRAMYLASQAKDDDLFYIHGAIGYNYRISNLQASLGVAQLEQLPNFLEIKKNNYQRYKDKLQNINGLRLLDLPKYATNNHWLYALQIEKDIYGMDIVSLMQFLNQNNIQTRPLWFLNHVQKCFQEFQSYKIKNAYELYEKTLNLPSSVSLTEENLNYICDKLINCKK